MRSLANKEVAMAKERAYDDLHGSLNCREGEKELCRLARQRDGAVRDVQHIRMIKNAEGNILASDENVLRRWKEYFEEMMNIENERERRLEEVEIVDRVSRGINREEVRSAMKRTKGGKAVDPGSIPVEARRSLEELADCLTKSLNVKRCRKSGEKVY
ncbi:uncharacterized protein [Penaeus vannamei]|uniref:uncharacterized protein n=1 Tax=Penaeus vannamei TaxID=6689 RepID=UPI00387F91A0